MAAKMSESAFPEDRRREIFRALVEAQDKGAPVASSRKAVAEQFGIRESQVRHIENEGLEKEWPPLGS
jgi:hypothetical protein